MARFVGRKASQKLRRVKSDTRDQRTMALQMAGLELLAKADFENVSIAKIAKTAKCSVGAFYYRYNDKNAYLRQLITVTFRGLENGLRNCLSGSGGQISLSEFISHIIVKLRTPENVGVIRAALKLGATDPDALRPYHNYREYVGITAENIFNGASKKKIARKKLGRPFKLFLRRLMTRQ